MKKQHTLDSLDQAHAADDATMQQLRSTQTRRPSARHLAALAGLVVLLLALATGLALHQAATARPASRAQHEGPNTAAPAPVAPASLPDTPRLQPQLASLDATLYGPAAAPAGATGLPDTPRQQRLAWLDARDYGPADGGAPPPQDDGHNHGPR
jgi:hypothetical protein